ncbi:hypothetical protein [Aquimarina celericrescens]|uniref:Transmembrane protein n=1 Tax=Aquimarina celericrescens TaxID=1964542 RepID=A0ABW5B3I1_9FLAO|nr:hypothetical protein [Aquimarina celericrescens]
MGFGGATAAMITSLKNNSRRNKREAFDGWTTSDKESQGIKVAPVSEDSLAKIREKLKRQRKVVFHKNLIALGLMILLIFGCMLYLLN